MATGTVKWLSDDKGFGPGMPRWGRILRARPTRERALERRVQHRQVGHLPADTSRLTRTARREATTPYVRLF